MLSKYFLEDSDIHVCNKYCSNVHKYPANPITNQPNQSNKKDNLLNVIQQYPTIPNTIMQFISQKQTKPTNT